jgi:hypothetical protein
MSPYLIDSMPNIVLDSCAGLIYIMYMEDTKMFNPFDLDSSSQSDKEIMRDKIIMAAKIAASETPDASSERLASLLEIGIDPTNREDCRATYEACFAYFSKYLNADDATCAALVIHSTGAQQRLMLGTLVERAA